MRIEGHILKVQVGRVRATAWLIKAEPAVLAIELFEPYRGITVALCAYNSFMGAMAWSCGDRSASLTTKEGTLTVLGAERAEMGIYGMIEDGFFFNRERELLTAARDRIIARLESRARKLHAIDATELAAAIATLEAQRKAGLDEPSYRRRLAALQARHEAGENVTRLWPARIAQHLEGKYRRRVSPARIRELFAVLGISPEPAATLKTTGPDRFGSVVTNAIGMNPAARVGLRAREG